MARPKKKDPIETAAQKTRRDSIVSSTMPHATRCLADMLAAARGLSRSEYLRYLVIQDGRANTNRVLAEAITEGVRVAMGRPTATATGISPFALQEEATRNALIKQYPFFEESDGWQTLFTDVDGESMFVIETSDGETSMWTRAEFVNLPLDTITVLIEQKISKD